MNNTKYNFLIEGRPKYRNIADLSEAIGISSRTIRRYIDEEKKKGPQRPRIQISINNTIIIVILLNNTKF